MRSTSYLRGDNPKVLHCRSAAAVLLAVSFSPHLEKSLAKPPNFKQEKKRREEAQKKKNEAKQLEKAARKERPADPQPK